ncbi:MAG: PIN like domain [Dehalococcoidia bacterium]|nr:PIN like domain [Dehalococcoidia bacterium]
MQLGGSDGSKKQQPKKVTFFLDECLPSWIAEFLSKVGYPITSWYEEFKGQQGFEDPWLISYLGAKGYTWITKDEKAKVEHEPNIRAAQISVIWIRGLERSKGQIPKHFTTKDLHRMLTDKLDGLVEEIRSAKRPLYFILYMSKSGKSTQLRVALEDFFKRK